MGWDLDFASAMFWSIMLIAFAAMVPFFSFSSASTIARWTSSGISAEVRRINSSKESASKFIEANLVSHRRQVNRGVLPPTPLAKHRRKDCGNCCKPWTFEACWGDAADHFYFERGRLFCGSLFGQGVAYEGPVAVSTGNRAAR